MKSIVFRLFMVGKGHVDEQASEERQVSLGTAQAMINAGKLSRSTFTGRSLFAQVYVL
jgi:hypothetical protein